MYTDSWFLTGLDDAVRLHLKHSSAPVYIYLYGYRGSESFSFVFGDPDHDYGKKKNDKHSQLCNNCFLELGVCHADELMHLFPISFNPAAKRTETDEAVTDFLTTLWTNFAATGWATYISYMSNKYLSPQFVLCFRNPNAEWNPATGEEMEYYFISTANESRMQKGLYSERAKFWRSLPLTYTRNKATIKDELW